MDKGNIPSREGVRPPLRADDANVDEISGGSIEPEVLSEPGNDPLRPDDADSFKSTVLKEAVLDCHSPEKNRGFGHGYKDILRFQRKAAELREPQGEKHRRVPRLRQPSNTHSSITESCSASLVIRMSRSLVGLSRGHSSPFHAGMVPVGSPLPKFD